MRALLLGVVAFTEDNEGFCLTSSIYRGEWEQVTTARNNAPIDNIESATITVRPGATPESIRSFVICALRNPAEGLPCASEISLSLDLGEAGQLDLSAPDLERGRPERGVAFARVARVDDGWTVTPFEQQLFSINGQSWPAFIEELKRA
jgi:hypothetical protein